MGSTEVEHDAQVVEAAAGDDGARRPSAGDPRPAVDQPTIDWSGRSAMGGSAGDAGTGPGPDDGGSGGTRRLAMVAGVVSLAYIAWVVVDLVVLASSGTAYTSMHRTLGSLGARAILCLVWLALLYHGLDGLRVVATEFRPGLGSRERVLRAMVAFVLFATWIPTSLIVVWPAIRRWFAA